MRFIIEMSSWFEVLELLEGSVGFLLQLLFGALLALVVNLLEPIFE